MSFLNFLFFLTNAAPNNILFWFADTEGLRRRSMVSAFETLTQNHNCLLIVGTWDVSTHLKARQYSKEFCQGKLYDTTDHYRVRKKVSQLINQDLWNPNGEPKANKIPPHILKPQNILSMYETYGEKIKEEAFNSKFKMKLIRQVLYSVGRDSDTTDFCLVQKVPVYIIDSDEDSVNRIHKEFDWFYFVDPFAVCFDSEDGFFDTLIAMVASKPQIRRQWSLLPKKDDVLSIATKGRRRSTTGVGLPPSPTNSLSGRSKVEENPRMTSVKSDENLGRMTRCKSTSSLPSIF